MSVPDHVLGGGVDIEPPEACAMRDWAYNFIWSIFCPVRENDPHFYDNYGDLGDQDSSNFHFFLHLLARMLEGRPIKRVVYFPPPRPQLQEAYRDYTLATARDICSAM